LLTAHAAGVKEYPQLMTDRRRAGERHSTVIDASRRRNVLRLECPTARQIWGQLMRNRRQLTFTFNCRLAAATSGLAFLLGAGCPGTARAVDGQGAGTLSPIQHLVVVFQENVSFDHYFATYPVALNPSGEPAFHAKDDTPSVNGLGTLLNGEPAGVLVTDNPNLNNSGNAPDTINPFRLARSQASTCDQDHDYGDEQSAFDQGLMDGFPANVGVGSCTAPYDWGKGKGLTMGYFDGNTVTALWNYAQQFAMNDNSFGTTFGPSTPGLLNLVAGNTYPAQITSGPTSGIAAITNGVGTVVSDPDPSGDVCSAATRTQVTMGGKNIGDLLNAKGISWGAFMGGFDLTITNPNGTTGCSRSSPASPANGGPAKDYVPHHAFFQYWVSTANPTHQRPNWLKAIGTSNDGGANHQYDINDFFAALAAHNLPAISFLKAIAAEDGHASNSDPLLEQQFLVRTVNTIMQSPFWRNTAIVIMYDDSDGWYDHQMSPIVNSSAVAPASPSDASNSDQLNGPGKCGNGLPLGGIQGRCGYGPRLPLLVMSPFAKVNFVDHTVTDQSSVLRFIEENWGTGPIGDGSFDQLAGPLWNMFDFEDRDFGEKTFGQRQIILDSATGQPANQH
jgi:phospholipase C